MIAALYVERAGCYFGIDGVDPWDEARDARLYPGPWPVVAHPPCERWGRYWGGGPMLHGSSSQKTLGDDGGCFASAVSAVRRFGGVLEHPQASHAWRHHGIATPPRNGGWIRGDSTGWTCCVEQGAYGHRARKATWLYAVDVDLPKLIARAEGDFVRLEAGYHSAEERARAIRTGACQRLSHRQRRATPLPFRDILLEMAHSAEFGG
jgi:hypothetical protein